MIFSKHKKTLIYLFLSKLLETMDQSVSEDKSTVELAVMDKAYMVQLVEVCMVTNVDVLIWVLDLLQLKGLS